MYPTCVSSKLCEFIYTTDDNSIDMQIREILFQHWVIFVVQRIVSVREVVGPVR